MKRTLFFIFLFFFSVLARAELTVEITQGVDKPTPVAVVPFAFSGVQALPEDVAKVINDDLYRSGMFKLMPRENMLSFPSDRSSLYFRDWRISGSDFIVIGRIKEIEGQLSVAFELYDILKEEQILREEGIKANRTNLRAVGHYISDKVFEALTGVRGAFSTHIVYVTAKQLAPSKHSYRLMYADSDGHNAREILNSNEPIMSPAWSQDGTKLAYVSFESGRPAVYIQYLATGKREKVQSFRGLNGAPSWSPDGRQLALVLSKDGNPEIYVLDLQQRRLTRITHHFGIDTEPSWSPDGQSLIFTSDRGGQPQIYSIYLPTRDVTRLTFEGQYNARGRLTQDGRFLAMVHQSNGSFHIAVQDLRTGRVDLLTETFMDESPTIAPNGSIILYATQEGVRGVLSAVSLDGRVKFRLPSSDGDVREPAWSPFQ
ncbi:Tol-Pal system beta propeller repeat protein TolB [Amphritea pacifica]|uniref:Tol-Pal system protein TolB n=1 Tax=Amphritea pacifica TaxID=2811233 RepID=A0ABS2W3G1_9GAMM|nr:Tol-Pal system beta propeller repeat protein TolB [Amphritea pacifica]MBN0986068.1 Tol-Pal system protein TolB [Amphritea pacifica]MBN1006848.1 Tol-Pal system protein TolB [Amphritea pacifica]